MRAYRGHGEEAGLRSFVDPAWRAGFRRNPHEFFWELFLADVFRRNGATLVPKAQSEGPDLGIALPGNGRCWIEATAPSPGNSNSNRDRVPEMPFGVMSQVPTDKIVLRLSRALSTKYDKIIDYRSRGLIAQDDPVVIALNGQLAANWRGDTNPSFVERVCFGIGGLTLEVDRNGRVLARFLAHAPSVTRASGKAWSTAFFNEAGRPRPEVSAVLFAMNDVANNTLVRGEAPGSELILVHNPLARLPLPSGLLETGQSVRAEGDGVNLTDINRTWHS